MKYSIRYNLKEKSAPTDDGRLRVRIRVSWAGQRVEMLTGHQVPPDYWLAAEQRAKPAYRHGKETGATINKELATITAHIDQHFAKCQVEQHTPTAGEMQTLLKGYFGKTAAADPNTPTFFGCFALFVEQMGMQNQWSDTTRRRVLNLRNHLQSFAPELEFSNLDADGLQLFMQYLFNKGLRNTTVEKDMSILRWFMRWAVLHKYTEETTARDYRPRLKGTDGSNKEIIYLEWEELMELYNFDFSTHPTYRNVRDVFCFCCFTGLRYSDVAKLTFDDIHDNHISVVTQKTNDNLRIELNQYSRAILERHRPQEGEQRRKALPVISNQKTNDYLKDIGKQIGLDTPIRIVYFQGNRRIEELHPKWELLTTHCARRTFVVNALRLGIPAEVIMKWTGHSDFSAMKPYIAIVDELKEREMSKFDLADTRSPKSPRK